MNVYEKKPWWKLYLSLFGLIIVLASLFYTNTIVNILSEDERNRADIIRITIESLNNGDPNDFSLQMTILEMNKSIPVILVSHTGQSIEGRNFGEDLDMDTTFLRKRLNKLIEAGAKPLTDGGGQKLYYEPSLFLKLLSYFPVLQLFLILTFVLIGYFAFTSVRKAEQNRVWVGMAKETAHQLGTPISGIMGWIEHLKFLRENDEEVKEVATEIGRDLAKLELIADRFSKIGSAPELKPTDMNKILKKNFDYIQKRAPRKVDFHLEEFQGNTFVSANTHLIDWVIENLLRNALDSIGAVGSISGTIQTDQNYIHIDISDSGKGIPANKFKTVFKPGYSTKKRGWGLGLSLAKRIVKDYHKGKIFVKESKENVKTTFRISLPLVEKTDAA